MNSITLLQTESAFQVYNASAGSGKTFTLVKEYLKILLSSEDIFAFQKVLAITFTNKAATEMKERVLKNLKDFSERKENVLSSVLLEETHLDWDVLQKRSEKVLQAILQNYSAFYISTIDSFTYKIVKSFAFDLGLSQNFEVEMDARQLLNEAVDVLISTIGTDKELTDILIDFSLEKADDDKSWDIARDLSEFSSILLNESDVPYFRALTDKSLQDFKQLQQKLSLHRKEIRKKMMAIGEEGLGIIQTMGLEFGDFYSSMLPKHFLALKDNPEAAKFFDASKLKERIEEGTFYTKSKSDDIKILIDGIIPELLRLYRQSESLYRQSVQNRMVLKNIIPLAVLNHINKELNRIKEDNNLRLNAEFNQLISDYIQDQPAPYIYERIGQKFMHYFIDEMQDTSVLQWKNLIPLIDNSLSQENTSLLLVGDGKQAIYRWRGGKAEQFINLGSDTNNSENPFLIRKNVRELETNFRSYSEIVNFNNLFFKHASQYIQNKSYRQLFSEKSYQKTNENTGGCVSISFLEKKDEKSDEQLKYAKKVLEILKNLDEGFYPSDVCVLVRKKKEGIAIANYLSENGVEIVSSETLLLSNSKKVNFIIDLLKYTLFSNDKESQFKILYFLRDFLKVSEEKHTFFERHIQLEILDFFESLKTLACNFDLLEHHQLPLYEKIEQIIHSFHLQKVPDAYVQFFLDEVLALQKKEAGVQDLLDFWDLKKDTLSVVCTENANAVRIMTIHKSKGLEFPIVIFPCDLDIYRELKPKAWLSIEDEKFPDLMVSLNKELQYVSEKGNVLYTKRREELELDNFNLLYVALTRPIEQLHIITEKRLNKSGREDIKYYSGIYISFLKEKGLWDENQSEYSFGNTLKQGPEEKVHTKPEVLNNFISTPWRDHQINLLASSSKLWGTSRGEAIDYGELIHEMMSHIKTVEDVESVVQHYTISGELNDDESERITKLIRDIVTHKRVKKYFSNEIVVYNEREIIGLDHQLIIPDRLVMDKNRNVAIIDYKTGVTKPSHQKQLESYANVLQSLNCSVQKKILIYINDSISIEEF